MGVTGASSRSSCYSESGCFWFEGSVFPDRSEDLGKLFVYSLTMLVKHFPYPVRVEFLFEHEVRKLILKLASDDPLRTTFSLIISLSVPPWRDAVILIKSQQGRIIVDVFFKCPLNVGFTTSEIEEMFMDGDGPSHKSSWYWTYSSIRFQPSSLVSELKRKGLSDQVLETDLGAFDRFVGPLLESKDLISKERGAACWKEVIEES
ncbi:hypothetical protein Tco_0477210 [Tanacetum coccineum]